MLKKRVDILVKSSIKFTLYITLQNFSRKLFQYFIYRDKYIFKKNI